MQTGQKCPTFLKLSLDFQKKFYILHFYHNKYFKENIVKIYYKRR